eukprot:CAMPEP_0113264784 /NCGR_PEP_ID=MMETSP0008_2-20120614/19154_1 /TAXON_ID=97485 /ORGANISM="Prymnesium parvum" /LENGTH=314 /DNA_ID=CAMNT_0000113561 /DNA_START=14 /DNA_END=958 /DNA_ORIENTATION=- /assembly_acc=CAM_ASM_000153
MMRHAARLGAAALAGKLALDAHAEAEGAWKPPRVWRYAEINTDHGLNRPTAGAQTVKDLPVGKHPLQLYSLGTPNGVRATIMLEEVCDSYPDFDYDAWLVPINGEQFTTGFVEINPNSKIPAMVDRTTTPPTRVFESGSILVYLAEKFPRTGLLPTDPSKRAECLNWVFWAVGSPPFVGGGFGHFYAYCKEKLEYPINRYTMETKRQLDVLNKHLATRKYMCGDEYTIADIAVWPWYGATVLGRMYGAAEFLEVDEYPNLKRWALHLEESRSAVRRGRMVNRGQERKQPGDTNPLYHDLPNLPSRHGREDWKWQ